MTRRLENPLTTWRHRRALTFVSESKDAYKAWAVILGHAQDGGVPQLHCFCPRCRSFRARGERVFSASVAVLVRAASELWRVVIDTGPDFRVQYETVLAKTARKEEGLARALAVPPATGNPVEAVLLTHLHMGHLVGLLEFGREIVNARGVNVFCTEDNAHFLAKQPPWSLLVSLGNIVLHPVRPGCPFSPCPGVEVTAHRIPHRNEFGDTVGFQLSALGGCSLLYIPDADTWDGLTPTLPDLVRAVDYALLDGTFFSVDELGGRRHQGEVPHPPVTQTAELLQRCLTSVRFIHLNHTNPLHEEDSPPCRWLEQQGFGVARTGMVLNLRG